MDPPLYMNRSNTTELDEFAPRPDSPPPVHAQLPNNEINKQERYTAFPPQMPEVAPQPFYPQQQQPYPGQYAYPPPQMYPQQPPQYFQPPPPQQYFQPPPQQPQQQQQQQSSVTVVNAGQTPTIGNVQPVVYHQSFCGHITLACFVFWCCGCLFGLIAFILAMIATDHAGTGKSSEARKLGRASLGVSIAGIVVGCVVIAITVGIEVTSYENYFSRQSNTIGQCYCQAYYYDSYANRNCYDCYVSTTTPKQCLCQATYFSTYAFRSCDECYISTTPPPLICFCYATLFGPIAYRNCYDCYN